MIKIPFETDPWICQMIPCIKKILVLIGMTLQTAMRNNILCATTFSARNIANFVACNEFCSTQLQMEMEIINDKLPFETDPWRC